MPSTKSTNRLATLRDAQGLSQTQLAAQLDVHYATVDRWEKGNHSIPEKHWAALSAIFGVSIAHLLGLDDENGNGRRAA